MEREEHGAASPIHRGERPLRSIDLLGLLTSVLLLALAALLPLAHRGEASLHLPTDVLMRDDVVVVLVGVEAAVTV